MKILIGSVDAEVIEVIEYFEGAPIVLRLVDAEIPCFEVSIALYCENDCLTVAARDGKLAGALLTLHKKVKEHKRNNK